jgi:uncharacterized coiled-coil DUF342 family protein
MDTINLELRELHRKSDCLRAKADELSISLSQLQSDVEEIKRTFQGFAFQPFKQVLYFAIFMVSVMTGGLYFQTNALRNEPHSRFEKLEQRITDAEKNINTSFEDLKQEVRANRK